MNNCPDYYGKRPRYMPPRRPYKNNLNFTKEELEEKKQRAIAEEAEKKRKKAEMMVKKVVNQEMQKVNDSLQAEPSDIHISLLNSVTQKWEEQKKMLIEEKARKVELDIRQNTGAWIPPTRAAGYTKNQLSIFDFSKAENEKKKSKTGEEEADESGKMKTTLSSCNSYGLPAKGKKKHLLDFSKEELEEKRQRAIAEEAEKKAKRVEMERLKNESRWIDIGRALCDITPEDFLLNEPAETGGEEATGEEIVASVHTFVENFKRLMGDCSKGTVFGNCFAMTGALCKVNQKSVVYIDQRIEKLKKAREEAARREAQQKERHEERWIEIGRAFCSLTPADVGIEDSEAQKAPEVPTTSQLNVSPDTVLSTLDLLEKAPGHAPEELAWRGEDVVANVYHFTTALRDLMGIHAKHTCLRSQFEFTSVFANVAEKSVRDRHPVRKVGRNK